MTRVMTRAAQKIFPDAVSIAGGEELDLADVYPPRLIKWPKVVALTVFGILCVLPGLYWWRLTTQKLRL